jgi:hypothetical protein
VLALYKQILFRFTVRPEVIEVPLDPKKPRNEIEKHWGLISDLQGGSKIGGAVLVEEIFTIQSSLLRALAGC